MVLPDLVFFIASHVATCIKRSLWKLKDKGCPLLALNNNIKAAYVKYKNRLSNMLFHLLDITSTRYEDKMKPVILIHTSVILVFIILFSVAFKNLLIHKHKNMDQMLADKGFAVVELFTSEGCSSCPPADKLIESVLNENLNKQLYILAYHVDYWDHQGWKDKFSDAAYSKRQVTYANRFQLATIYTPQIVVNGKKEFVGSDRKALLSPISEAFQDEIKVIFTIVSTVIDYQINVKCQTSAPVKNMDLVIALVQKRGQNKVKAGENSGRMLTHVQIVRRLAVETLQSSSGNLTLTLPRDDRSNQWEIIGYVQDKTKGTILSAVKSQLNITASNE